MWRRCANGNPSGGGVASAAPCILTRAELADSFAEAVLCWDVATGRAADHTCVSKLVGRAVVAAGAACLCSITLCPILLGTADCAGCQKAVPAQDATHITAIGVLVKSAGVIRVTYSASSSSS